MKTQVLEGTLAEVQRQLSKLPLKPEQRLRVVVSEPEATAPADQETPPSVDTSEGVPASITLEKVKELQEDDDEYFLRFYPTARR